MTLTTGLASAITLYHRLEELTVLDPVLKWATVLPLSHALMKEVST
jgi:hypothetical protein